MWLYEDLARRCLVSSVQKMEHRASQQADVYS